jgi:hypothetical protein
MPLGEDDRLNESSDPPNGHGALFAVLGSRRILYDVMRIIENCDCLSEADVMFMLVGLVFGWIPLKVHTLS